MIEWMAEWDGDNNDLNFQPLDGDYHPQRIPSGKYLAK